MRCATRGGPRLRVGGTRLRVAQSGRVISAMGGECIEESIEVDEQTAGVSLVPELTPATVTQRENQQNIASLRSFQLGVQLAQMALSR